MNTARANTLIVTSLAVTGTVAAGSGLSRGELPGVSLVVGLAGAGVGLAVAAQFAPDLAGMFAVLLMAGAVFAYGEPFFTAVAGITGGQPKPKRGHAKP